MSVSDVTLISKIQHAADLLYFCHNILKGDCIQYELSSHIVSEEGKIRMNIKFSVQGGESHDVIIFDILSLCITAVEMGMGSIFHGHVH
jgi:hypothetical protein